MGRRAPRRPQGDSDRIRKVATRQNSTSHFVLGVRGAQGMPMKPTDNVCGSYAHDTAHTPRPLGSGSTRVRKTLPLVQTDMTSTVHTRTSTQKHTRERWAGDAGGAAIRMVWGEGKVVSTGGVGGGGRGGGAWLCCGGERTAAGVREMG